MVEHQNLELIPIDDTGDYSNLQPGVGVVIRLIRENETEPRPCLVMACPDCGKIAYCDKHHHFFNTLFDTITLNPSVKCSDCGAHYWIKEGEIIPA